MTSLVGLLREGRDLKMQPIDAIKTCFSKYVNFNGRARRSEFWWWYLFLVVVQIVTQLIDRLLGFGSTDVSTGTGSISVASSGGPISAIAMLALLLPTIAVAVRRLHDTNKSGWFVLLYLIPCVGLILMIVFSVKDSDPDNQYGPNPKNPGMGGAPGGYGQPGQQYPGGPTYQ